MIQLPIKKLRLQNGFTLIELTIVFGIIAIIGGVGFAAYSSFATRQKLDSAAYDLKAGIEEAKHTAIARVKPASCGATTSLEGYNLTICSGSACTNLYTISPVCLNATPTPTPLVKVRDTQILATVDTCSNPLIFSSQTGLTSGSCRILLTDTQDSSGNTAKTVCVDAGGNVTIKDGNASC